MPLVKTRGAASAQGFGEFAQAAAAPLYIEDVFSCFLYTGNGSTQTITNGIDLAGKGGLVWQKVRSPTAGYDHVLTDTVTSGTGASTKFLSSNTTNSFSSNTGNIIGSYNSTGFTLNNGSGFNNVSGENAVSWTFREQPKFFDVVTYTGTGSNTTIAHALGAVPGSIIVKRTDTTTNWIVYHRSLTDATRYLVLNNTSAEQTLATIWNSTAPTSTVFSLGTNGSVNGSGGTYVAYLFAHDAGGFGLTGTDNVISCGSFTSDGSGNATVNLGYEPQFWLYKPVGTGGWTIYDTMRGWSQTSIFNLNPNTSGAEGGGSATLFYPTATGFDCVGGALAASASFIYIAIRRGPMKVPTLGTSVFSPNASSGSTGTALVTNFPVDLSISTVRSGDNRYFSDRLRGINSPGLTANRPYLSSDTTNAEATGASFPRGWDNTQILVPPYYSGSSSMWWNFRRAPGFFDEVCYTGTGATQTIAHNLGVAPELYIVKQRSSAQGWCVGSSYIANTGKLALQTTSEVFTDSTAWNSTYPTSSVLTVGSLANTNENAKNFVAYLFASAPGVSKVGSYTGNGSTQTINCGFTGGARFVLLKRTDAASDWYVYDTARGMTVLTDPYLFLNSTAAEVATLGSVTTVSTGFALNSAILADINVSSGTYIFLAIA